MCRVKEHTKDMGVELTRSSRWLVNIITCSFLNSQSPFSDSRRVGIWWIRTSIVRVKQDALCRPTFGWIIIFVHKLTSQDGVIIWMENSETDKSDFPLNMAYLLQKQI